MPDFVPPSQKGSRCQRAWEAGRGVTDVFFRSFLLLGISRGHRERVAALGQSRRLAKGSATELQHRQSVTSCAGGWGTALLRISSFLPTAALRPHLTLLRITWFTGLVRMLESANKAPGAQAALLPHASPFLPGVLADRLEARDLCRSPTTEPAPTQQNVQPGNLQPHNRQKGR